VAQFENLLKDYKFLDLIERQGLRAVVLPWVLSREEPPEAAV
jgi:hypothetical protein